MKARNKNIAKFWLHFAALGKVLKAEPRSATFVTKEGYRKARAAQGAERYSVHQKVTWVWACQKPRQGPKQSHRNCQALRSAAEGGDDGDHEGSLDHEAGVKRERQSGEGRMWEQACLIGKQSV